MMKWLNLCLPINVKGNGHVHSAVFTEPIVLDSWQSARDALVASCKNVKLSSPKIVEGFVA